ncbi:RloB domain-containing protein [Ruminiclostridium herbifermentans]|uniref:RloB domain-containing protein n=1 Tax=Ruminiclostridium herbifermentans TaxID=2488810 RepID=A0A4U7JJ80_9FIRM|nr:RloB family protein [Ruminiclostridium herbifermentans]QNU65962.1 RloB domain-containing protein [Ruminiclostridium herbifermentans]
MINRYRLASTTFDREKEEDKVEPQKIYFLSVEGNATEKEYFEGISANRKKLGINSKVDVEVLKRGSKDTNCAPQQVIELLEEYIRLRNLGKENLIQDIPNEFINKYGNDFILKYLNNPNDIPKKKKNAFVTDLMKIGYDINYRRYLQKYDKDLDEFCILIDRDIQTHSETNMIECIQYCKDKARNYKCYIVNPCFEFWLLLHLSDVKEEYKERLDIIQKNPKVTDKHTFNSKEVSEKMHHGKSGINFKKNYLMHIDDAIERAKQFANDEEELVTNIGCNIWKLIEEMKKYK